MQINLEPSQVREYIDGKREFLCKWHRGEVLPGMSFKQRDLEKDKLEICFIGEVHAIIDVSPTYHFHVESDEDEEEIIILYKGDYTEDEIYVNALFPNDLLQNVEWISAENMNMEEARYFVVIDDVEYCQDGTDIYYKIKIKDLKCTS